jgi:hypothetical protein
MPWFEVRILDVTIAAIPCYAIERLRENFRQHESTR